MILKKITLESIRSYEHAVVDFSPGSTLLSGDIGSGKTTILLAAEFALFGLQPGQKGTSLLRSSAHEGKVILECDIDGKNVCIERTLKRGKKSVTQEYAAITVDNERFEESVTEIKDKVLTLLNYPKEFAKKTNLLYKFTVYTPQEEMKQIILEPDDIRLNTLRHVFGIDKYKRIDENIAVITIKLREKIRLNEGIIYDLEQDKKTLQEKNKSLLDIKEKQRKIAESVRKAIELREQKEKVLEEIKEKVEEKKNLETERSKSQLLIAEKRQQLTNYANVKKNLETQMSEAQKKPFNEEEYNALEQRTQFQEDKESELQKEYADVLGKIKAAEAKRSELTELQKTLQGIEECPTCLQTVTAEYKDNIFQRSKREHEIVHAQLNAFHQSKNECIEKIESVKRAKNDIKKRKADLELLKVKHESIKEKNTRISEIEEQEKILNNDKNLLEKHRESIEKTIAEYALFDQEYTQRKEALEIAQKAEHATNITQAEVNKERQFLEQQIEEKKQEIEKKQKIKEKIEMMQQLEYWLSEKFADLVLFTEKQVMLTLKEEFSTLFTRWFATLVGDALTAKLDDTFSPVIEQHDYELDYAFLSGGERTAVALAYRLSLNQVINSLLSKIKTRDLVILDEPTDGFSASQLDKMRDVLHQLNVTQLILVSHEQKIESFVDNIIRCRKEQGITKIE